MDPGLVAGRPVDHLHGHAVGRRHRPPQPQANRAPGRRPADRRAGASIWIVRTDGSDASGSARRGRLRGRRDVGPTGRASPTSRGRVGGQSDIHIATVRAHGLTDDAIVAAEPRTIGARLGARRRRIAFTSNRSGNDEIGRSHRRRRPLVQLTNDGGGDWVPAFSPDGHVSRSSPTGRASPRSGRWRPTARIPEPQQPPTALRRPVEPQLGARRDPSGLRRPASFQDRPGRAGCARTSRRRRPSSWVSALAILALLVVALGAPLWLVHGRRD